MIFAKTVCQFVTIMLSILGLLVGSGGELAAHAAQQGRGPVSVTVLDGLFVKEMPLNPVGVKDAKEKNQQGDKVVLFGRVGGRPVPFVDGRAVFLLADETLLPCTEGCATPWDFCCTPPNIVMEGLATVQVLGSNGRPLKAPLQNVNGLRPLAEVVVEGTVAKRDKNLFVVNAERIYVRPGGK